MGYNCLVPFMWILILAAQYHTVHSARFPLSLIFGSGNTQKIPKASSNNPDNTNIETQTMPRTSSNIPENTKVENDFIYKQKQIEELKEDIKKELIVFGDKISEDIRKDVSGLFEDSQKSPSKYCSNNISCDLIHMEADRILAILEDLLYKYDTVASNIRPGNLNAMDLIMFPELPIVPARPAEGYVKPTDDHAARMELVKLFGFMQRYGHAFTSVILDQSLHESKSLGDMFFAQDNLRSLLRVMDFVLTSDLGGRPDVSVINELTHLTYTSGAGPTTRRSRRTACLRQCIHGIRYIKELFSN